MKRVLVVDDDDNVVEVISANLVAEGYEVEVTGDGATAWERVVTAPPDLVVLDWMLPGRSGLDLLRDFRRHPRTRHLPIVMLSAKASDAEIWEGWQAGADFYLTKPFMIEQLLHHLEQLSAPIG
ncbi:MAG: response regulator transcription factor [Acidimicrobiales bacterium]